MGICNKNQQNFTLRINRNTRKAEREREIEQLND